ncbi:Zinc metalloproteinase nas-15 [Armadillidium vulgare]|nr:Zinc metalloproteinase nas-15 [Armadillidium vulgare]
MHSLGFWHEQARPDRDRYITIIWENIQMGLSYNFGKYDWDTIQNLSVPYDLGSIMHYGSNAFAKNRTKPTIISNNGEEIGQRYGLSEIVICFRAFISFVQSNCHLFSNIYKLRKRSRKYLEVNGAYFVNTVKITISWS